VDSELPAPADSEPAAAPTATRRSASGRRLTRTEAQARPGSARAAGPRAGEPLETRARRPCAARAERGRTSWHTSGAAAAAGPGTRPGGAASESPGDRQSAQRPGSPESDRDRRDSARAVVLIGLVRHVTLSNPPATVSDSVTHGLSHRDRRSGELELDSDLERLRETPESCQSESPGPGASNSPGLGH
jgi:hypothetical protein